MLLEMLPCTYNSLRAATCKAVVPSMFSFTECPVSSSFFICLISLLLTASTKVILLTFRMKLLLDHYPASDPQLTSIFIFQCQQSRSPVACQRAHARDTRAPTLKFYPKKTQYPIPIPITQLYSAH